MPCMHCRVRTAMSSVCLCSLNINKVLPSVYHQLPGKRDNARNNARCTKARKATHGLDGQHQDVDRTLRGRVSQNDRGQGLMEKVRSWCGQPSDRGRLKNRTEQLSETLVIIVSTSFFPILAFHTPSYSRYSLTPRRHQLSLPLLNTVLHRNIFISRCLFQSV